MELKDLLYIFLLLVILVEVSYVIYIMHSSRARSKNTAMYVDTSVLMDGRILEVAKTGFITADLIIPRSVIGELQLLADGSDSSKRTRARYGLDIAQKLKDCDNISVKILQDSGMPQENVDDRLLSLVKKYGGVICTIDYNLNKVAQVEGIGVVNINELSKNVRFLHLPGETIKLDITQKGQEANQGVGYTSDGTMVVIENASKYIGKSMEVELVRALQTDAGKMMFAKLTPTSSKNNILKNSKYTSDTVIAKIKSSGRKMNHKNISNNSNRAREENKSSIVASKKATAKSKSSKQILSAVGGKSQKPKSISKKSTKTKTKEDVLISLLKENQK
jgi:pilT protein domain protein